MSGASYQQIADALGIGGKTTLNQQHNAREYVVQALSEIPLEPNEMMLKMRQWAAVAHMSSWRTGATKRRFQTLRSRRSMWFYRTFLEAFAGDGARTFVGVAGSLWAKDLPQGMQI